MRPVPTSLFLLLLACGDKDGGSDDGGDDGRPVAVDADGDGWTADQDCDDSDAAISPDALEYCDGIDNDCDGVIDEDSAEDAPVWCLDQDGDGYGTDEDSDRACTPPGPDHVTACHDCDDNDVDFHPDAIEDDCTDPNDYDCDGSTTWADEDGDGEPACVDCDDHDATVFNGAPELCDGVDNDCDGLVDDDDAPTDPSWWYEDADGDGHGVPSPSVLACDPGDGWSLLADDCNDGDASVSPSADEICDDADVDEDCDGQADDDDSDTLSSSLLGWYIDQDEDGYGDMDGLPTWRCNDLSDGSSHYASNGDDCDDRDAGVSPGADEICDGSTAAGAGTDEDCDGLIDDEDTVEEAGLLRWYPDRDEDGFGDASAIAEARCDDPSGTVSYLQDDRDCDDEDPRINPDGSEICDDADDDEDCDGLVDDDDDSLDSSTSTTWYEDTDGDGYGDAAAEAQWCDAPGPGWVSDSSDCDDRRAYVHPEADELCNGRDDDCDGLSFEGEGVAHVDLSGDTTDESATFAAGTASRPAEYDLVDDGTLWVCEGTWYARVRVSADATVTSEADAADAIIDAAGAGSAVYLDGPSSAEVSHLTLQGGTGTLLTGTTTYGGSLFSYGVDDLALDDLILRDSEATVGGCLAFVSSEGTASDMEISDCSATRGGGIYASYGPLTISDTTVSDCSATTYGGGVYAANGWGSNRTDLLRVLLDGNAAGAAGGGLYLSQGWMTFDCTDRSTCGVLSSVGGGIYLVRSSSTGYLWMTAVDLGRAPSGDDNNPYDITVDTSFALLAYAAYGDDVDVDCDTDYGCR